MRLSVLVLLSAVVCAQDRAYELSWTQGNRSRYGAIRRTLKAILPDGGATVPADVEQPWLGSWPLLSGRLAILVDAKTNRYWLDTDGDDSFLDEKPRAFANRYGTLVISLRYRGVPLLIERRESDPVSVLRVTVLAHRAGRVVLEGRERQFEAFDLDGDAQPDLVRLDANGNGALDGVESAASGVAIGVRAGAYKTVFSAHGARVRFERVGGAPPRPPERWSRVFVSSGGRRVSGSKIDVAKEWERAQRSRGFAQIFALRRIAATGTREAARVLWSAYRRSRTDELKLVALESLGYREYADYSDRIGSVARSHKDAAIRGTALDALHNMAAPNRGRTLRLVLEREREPELAKRAARYLAALGEPGRAELRDAALKLNYRPNRVHAYWFGTRTAEKAPPREFVRAAAASPDPDLRAAALNDARALAYPDAHALALAAASSPKMTPRLRLVLTEDLASWGDAASVRALLPLAVGARPTTRTRMIALLRAVRDPQVVAVLLTELEEAKPASRALCAAVLARLPANADAVLVRRLGEERHELVLIALMRACGLRRTPGASFAIVAAARKRARRRDVQTAALAALGRLGLDEPVALEYMRELAGAAKWEDRIAVLDAIANAAERAQPASRTGAAGVLATALDDSKWQVRMAAIQGLSRLRVRAAVPPLIARLGREKQKRLRGAIVRALHRLTHRQFFDDAAAWERWWFADKSTFSVPKDPPGAAKAKKKGRTVAFYGIPVDSERVVFVIDQSGSMSAPITSTGPGVFENRLEKAKAETLKVVAKLPDRARVNVVFFESDVDKWREGALAPLFGSTRRALDLYVKKRQPAGGTDLFGGLELALKMRDVDTIYLLSDGSPSTGLTDEDDILEQVQLLNRTRRITIHCVSVGRRSTLLQRLAAASGGTYARR